MLRVALNSEGKVGLMMNFPRYSLHRLLALLPAMAGMWLGQCLRQRVSATLFKRVFFIGMALLGTHLLISG